MLLHLKDFEICKSSCCTTIIGLAVATDLVYVTETGLQFWSAVLVRSLQGSHRSLLFQISGLQQNTLLPGLMSLVDNEVSPRPPDISLSHSHLRRQILEGTARTAPATAASGQISGTRTSSSAPNIKVNEYLLLLPL